MGLPTAGKQSTQPQAGDIVRRAVATCFLGEQVGDVSQRVDAEDGAMAIVVDEKGVVLGRLRQKIFSQHLEAIVGDVMQEGPTTIRPNIKLVDIIPRMQAKNVSSIVVTTTDGRLTGILYRKDGETLLAQNRSSK